MEQVVEPNLFASLWFLIAISGHVRNRLANFEFLEHGDYMC